jgi:hypothetical protein
LLLLAGRFDKFFPPAELKARTDARLVISPWSNHGFELYDPLLVNAATEAACITVGKTPRTAPISWRWRLVGLALGLLGTLDLVSCLPNLPHGWRWTHGPLAATVFIFSFILIAGTWLDVLPHWRFLPLQLTATVFTWIVLKGAGRLRISRWVLLALAAVLWVGCMITNVNLSGPHGVVISTLLMPALLLGTILGEIVSHRGSCRDGDIAMAIIVGCALFQWARPPKLAETQPKSHVATTLDTKLYDSCVGQYEFPPDNVFSSGIKLTILRKGEQLIGQASGKHVFQGAFNIYPESETNFFLINGAQLILIKNDIGEVTAVISRAEGVPDSEGKKLRN